ncbi:hypothetical protein BDW75DRAFT_235014 [Aspergillus navahoensis]
MYQVGLNEAEILKILQLEGFDIQARTLRYIRHSLGLVEKVMDTLRTELSTGQIKAMDGECFIHTPRAKDCLAAASSGCLYCSGPNFIWSIDGYLKLAPYGIEIYAAIDAYSR